jgi:hypothetical protein
MRPDVVARRRLLELLLPILDLEIYKVHEGS